MHTTVETLWNGEISDIGRLVKLLLIVFELWLINYSFIHTI